MSTQGRVVSGFAHELIQPLTVMGVLAAMTWLCLAGFKAALTNPYLIAVILFLEAGGLACCIGALTAALRDPPQESFIPLPAQAFGWLGGVFGLAFILWPMGKPAEVGAGAEFGLIGIVLSGITILGIVGLIVLSLFLLLHRGEGLAEEPEPEMDSLVTKKTPDTSRKRGNSADAVRNVA